VAALLPWVDLPQDLLELGFRGAGGASVVVAARETEETVLAGRLSPVGLLHGLLVVELS